MPAPHKSQKAKGGKPMVGASAKDAAAVAAAAALAEFAASPASFLVFMVEEDIGVPKKGVSDYIIKAVRAGGGKMVDTIVPRNLLTNNGKLALPAMGKFNARLLVKQVMVQRKRLCDVANGGHGGAKMEILITETDHIVCAVLE
jgi:hypothetical protein